MWDESVKACMTPTRGRKKKSESQPSQEDKNVKRALRLAREGQYSRSLQSLLSAGMAQNTRANIKEMKDKHPQEPVADQVQGPLPDQDTPQISLTVDQVVNCIKSFRKGTAPGPSGLRAEHLKEAIRSVPPNRTDKAAAAITGLVNCMGGGKVPAEVAPYLCGAALFAAVKKDGSLRPIAVGEILRRLTSKGFSRVSAEKAAGILSPHQLGVGVPGGCEGIAHTVRQVVEEDPDLLVLRVDLINAFNTADRWTTFREMERLFPECMNWIRTCYGGQVELVFGDTIIMSSVGFHQGDPLASLLFSVNLQPVIEMIRHEVPTLKLNAWYLDDGVLVGRKEELQLVIDILLREGPARGLHLSMTKSDVWCPSDIFGIGEDPLDRGNVVSPL